MGFKLFSFLTRWFASKAPTPGSSSEATQSSTVDDPFLQDRLYSSGEQAGDPFQWQASQEETLFSDDDLFANTTCDVSMMEHDSLGSSAINPATGLPMCGSLDVAGNPFGCDSSIGMDPIGSVDGGIGDSFGSDIGCSFDSGISDSFDSGIGSSFDDW
ncbi:hypothetical protein [Ferrimonas sp. YFM]|uniref:hypothetical protein n=1 Tax=Ferrimonas sp. YFM TaxID=3028878 RepID=UPI0025741A7F|nr:hypothetical protein [Ferrimonas sp. YFM]BDY05725.1 hypothetical protein F0521_27660 [Ferrimonas sp. YFM]